MIMAPSSLTEKYFFQLILPQAATHQILKIIRMATQLSLTRSTLRNRNWKRLQRCDTDLHRYVQDQDDNYNGAHRYVKNSLLSRDSTCKKLD